jgi:carbon-monoxide dehydrogenase medium subunit
MLNFDYQAPRSLDEVYALLAQRGDDARLIAGGTALVLLMKQRLVFPELLVSLRQIDELKTVEQENGRIRIGATATHRQIERHPLVQEHLPALADTLRRVATTRVRNQATLGGNLAHADPNQDPPATLIALGAAVRLRSSGGSREVGVEDFFTDYYETALRSGEVLTDVLVPLPASGQSAAFVKFLPRSSDDYATVAAAASLRLDQGVCRDVRIALGSAGPTPLRAREAEAVLEGQRPSQALLRTTGEAARAAASPLSDVRGSADYKRDMAAVFTARVVRSALERLGHSVAG